MKNFSFKQINATTRGQIESLLNERMNITQIANKIGYDPSSIRKEVKRNRIQVDIQKKCYNCDLNINCSIKNLCQVAGKGCGYCKNCKELDVTKLCSKHVFKSDCEFLNTAPYLCNGCHKIKRCKRGKSFYRANEANSLSEIKKSNSRKVPKLDELEMKKLDEIVSPLVIKGISLKVILNHYSDKIAVSHSTLYNYVNQKYLSCRNHHLIELVSRKVNSSNFDYKHKRNQIKNHNKDGRSINDLEESIKLLDETSIAELDTVEGVKGGSVLFTCMLRGTHFMFAKKIPSKTQQEVIKALDSIELCLGQYFTILFKTTITDNGVEFLDFESMQRSIINSDIKRLALHYANPYCSFEKPRVENNHKLIRRFIPKGINIDFINNHQILDMMNQINNYPRKSLNYSSPYLELKKLIGEDILEKMGYYHIPIEEIVIKPLKLNPNK